MLEPSSFPQESRCAPDTVSMDGHTMDHVCQHSEQKATPDKPPSISDPVKQHLVAALTKASHGTESPHSSPKLCANESEPRGPTQRKCTRTGSRHCATAHKISTRSSPCLDEPHLPYVTSPRTTPQEQRHDVSSDDERMGVMYPASSSVDTRESSVDDHVGWSARFSDLSLGKINVIDAVTRYVDNQVTEHGRFLYFVQESCVDHGTRYSNRTARQLRHCCSHRHRALQQMLATNVDHVIGSRPTRQSSVDMPRLWLYQQRYNPRPDKTGSSVDFENFDTLETSVDHAAQHLSTRGERPRAARSPWLPFHSMLLYDASDDVDNKGLINEYTDKCEVMLELITDYVTCLLEELEAKLLGYEQYVYAKHVIERHVTLMTPLADFAVKTGIWPLLGPVPAADIRITAV